MMLVFTWFISGLFPKETLWGKEKQVSTTLPFFLIIRNVSVWLASCTEYKALYEENTVGKKKLMVTALGFSQIIREESCMQLTSHAPRSFVTHGEKLNYGFKLRLQTQGGVDEMKIFANGSYLQDYDSSLPSSIPIQSGWTFIFTGSASVTVSYSAPLGALVRPNLHVTFLDNGFITDETEIIGEYVFITAPNIHVSEGTPFYVDVKETPKIDASITLLDGPMENSLLKVFMPRNDSTDGDDLYEEEPYMSIIKVQFVSNAGLEKESVDLVGKISPYYSSNTRTSEIDQVSVAIPELLVQNGQVAELQFVTEVEMLDYAGALDGQEMVIGYVLEVGDGIFVVGNSSMIFEEKTDIRRTPNLSVLVEIDDFVATGSQYSVLLEIGLEHAQDSWGSAYNISWNIFFPAYLVNVTVGRTSDMLRLNRWFYNNRIVLNSTVFEFELKRLSFVHETKVYLNMTIDPQHVEFDQEQMTIYADAVYNGWRDDDEFVTSDGFTFKLDVDKNKDPVFACKCTENEKFDCVCDDSRKNGCDVKETGNRCVDCNTPWKCAKTLPGYGKRSRLNDKQGNKYRCGKAERNMRVDDLKPCILINSTGQIQELNADIGALLGKNGTGDALYGISRNGLAYIASYDGGYTWSTIPPDLYYTVSASPKFVHVSVF